MNPGLDLPAQPDAGPQRSGLFLVCVNRFAPLSLLGYPPR